MYNLGVFLTCANIQFLLGFNTEAAAKTAKDNIHALRKSWLEKKADSQVIVKDDFGAVLDVLASVIGAVFFEVCSQAREAQIERDIVLKRTDAEFKKRRDNNVELMRLYPDQRMIQPASGGMMQ